MTGIPGYKKAVDEFVTQAQTWVDQASAAAKASAAKLDAGTYTAADYTADMVQGATLVATGWAGLLAAFLDAATVLGTPPSTTPKVTSQPVNLAAPAPSACSLALTGPLVSLKGDQIPAAQVTFTPPSLAAGDTSFALEVTPGGAPIGVYFGTVAVTPATGAAETVPVSVPIV